MRSSDALRRQAEDFLRQRFMVSDDDIDELAQLLKATAQDSYNEGFADAQRAADHAYWGSLDL